MYAVLAEGSLLTRPGSLQILPAHAHQLYSIFSNLDISLVSDLCACVDDDDDDDDDDLTRVCIYHYHNHPPTPQPMVDCQD